MFVLKTVALLAISPLILSGGGAWGCRSNQNPGLPAEKPAPPVVATQKPGSAQIKILAEGFHSSITKPFVAVVRDAETYGALIKLDGNLPKLDADFFKTNTVIAAFLGERNTGGYSVEIISGPVEIQVREKKPAKDAMVTQVITSPFKLVTLEGVSNSAVSIDLDEAWRQQVQSFSILTGKFKMSGGFAGISEEFAVKGAVGVISQGNVATLQFRLVGTGAAGKRSLADWATGVVGSDGRIQLNQFSAGSFVSSPNAGLWAEGKFNDPWTEFSLNLISRPSMIADGFSGQGSLEAFASKSAGKP
jgi:protease stability complex PrcB-like protein